MLSRLTARLGTLEGHDVTRAAGGIRARPASPGAVGFASTGHAARGAGGEAMSSHAWPPAKPGGVARG